MAPEWMRILRAVFLMSGVMFMVEALAPGSSLLWVVLAAGCFAAFTSTLPR